MLSRLGLFVMLFLILHIQPRGDLPAAYFPQAIAVLHGALPYRDVFTTYAPLHPYLDAAALLVWRSPLALILLAILFEAVLVPVWLILGRELFTEQQVRCATLLYICNPLSLQFVAVDGQNNVIVALFLALAVLCLLKYRSAVSGALVGLGVVCVKFLPLLYFPAFLLAAKRRLRWFCGFAGVMVVGYGGFVLLHLPVLLPLRIQGNLKTASNVPYIIESLFHVDIPGRGSDGLLLLIVLGVLAVVANVLRRASHTGRMRILVFAMAALTLAMEAFSKKSWSSYLLLALFPVTLLVTDGRHRRLRLAAFALFSMMATVAQSYWATVFQEPLAPAFHSMLVMRRPSALVFLAMQLILVASYLWLLAEAMHRITSDGGLRHGEPSSANP